VVSVRTLQARLESSICTGLSFVGIESEGVIESNILMTAVKFQFTGKTVPAPAVSAVNNCEITSPFHI